MKYKLTKTAWKQIGRQAGWMKDRDYNIIGNDSDPEKYISINVPNLYNLDIEVNGKVYYEFEPTQYGGGEDPSWDAHYNLLHSEVTDINYLSNGAIEDYPRDGVEKMFKKFISDNEYDLASDMIEYFSDT